jgi:hypothetical protein
VVQEKLSFSFNAEEYQTGGFACYPKLKKPSEHGYCSVLDVRKEWG